MTRTYHPTPELQVRLVAGYDVVLGPGKADLLDAIGSTGSITRAASELGISYKKAWQLLSTMNAHLPEPVVETEVGGSKRGGAALTAFGQEVLRQYRAIQALIDPVHSADARSLLDWVPAPKGD